MKTHVRKIMKGNENIPFYIYVLEKRTNSLSLTHREVMLTVKSDGMSVTNY